MARKTGQSASPTARPRKAKDTSVVTVPGVKGNKNHTLVTGKSATTGKR
jgi:hypothetical protein